MVDYSESDLMMKISEKMDISDIYKGFSRVIFHSIFKNLSDEILE